MRYLRRIPSNGIIYPNASGNHDWIAEKEGYELIEHLRLEYGFYDTSPKVAIGMTNGPNLKLICVSVKNYYALKELGRTADSFNDIVTKLLAQASKMQRLKSQEPQIDR
jgi:hypothetical protein